MRLFALVVLAAAGCGADLPGNSPYRGAWNSLTVNGGQSLGGFQVDDHGRFDFNSGDAQISGAIAPDGKISGSAQSIAAPGSCAMSGSCSSTSVCTGSTAGGGCPADASGRPWATFAFCRSAGC